MSKFLLSLLFTARQVTVATHAMMHSLRACFLTCSQIWQVQIIDAWIWIWIDLELDQNCKPCKINSWIDKIQLCVCYSNWEDISRSRPNWIVGPDPKSGSARKSELHGPENGVSRWQRPNLDLYSQNYHFGFVYKVIYQFLGMEPKNYKFGMFCQKCHPTVALGDADIWPRNASRIHTCHLFTL